MKRFLLSFLTLLLLIPITARAEEKSADYTIEFSSESSDGTADLKNTTYSKYTTDSGSIINSAEFSKVYSGKSGLKFGSSSANGSLTFTLKNAIDVDYVVISATAYSSDASPSFKFNDSSTATTITGSDLTISNVGSISTIKIEGSASAKANYRFYLKSITIYLRSAETGGDESAAAVTPTISVANNYSSDVELG